MTKIYLDNNATTRVPDEVLDAMTPYYRDWYGNAHASHTLGRRAHEAVEQARAEVAALMHCNRGQVIFTSCGTEGNAMVLRGVLEDMPARKRIVTTAVEHPSVLKLLQALQIRRRIDLAVVPVGSDGEIDLDAMAAAIDHRTLLVSAMLAQNETGVIHPVAKIAELAHAKGAVFHVDAVQAAGKIDVSLDDLGADFVTISGHKLHAPKGVGALISRPNSRLAPIWYGGGQELGMRSGTEPVPSIVGFGVAARLALASLGEADRIRAMRDRFEATLMEKLDDLSINGASQPRLPNTSNVSFHGMPADYLAAALDAEQIYASAGAACHSGMAEPTATMVAMGKPLRVAMGAVRFSLSRYTTEEEVDHAAERVSSMVASMRKAAYEQAASPN